MKRISHRLMIAIVILLLSQGGGYSSVPGTSSLVSLSYLKIKGSTNVNKFDINYKIINSLGEREQLLFKPFINDNELIVVLIPVDCLESENRMLQKDFYDLLQTDKYSFIRIQISEKSVIRALENDLRSLEFCITIAGETDYIEFDLTSIQTDNNTWFLETKKAVMLNQFGLEAPEKFGGLIKVNSKLIVSFGMYFDLQYLSARE